MPSKQNKKKQENEVKVLNEEIALAQTFTDAGVEKKEGYQVVLPNFEGPLDLLLYLIKREEIDIYDIPIAVITRQYLETIELMRELDLEVAGEFILMAATLIQIKVRMLLPKNEDSLEEPEDDPRAELVRQILEYKRFKEAAESMMEMENHQRRFYPRCDFSWTKSFVTRDDTSDDEFMRDVDLFDLLTAFKKVLDEAPKVTSHHVGLIGVTIEEQIDFLMQVLDEKERITFAELMETMADKVFIVVTFMAILELIRTHQIRVQQAALFGEIWIQKR